MESGEYVPGSFWFYEPNKGAAMFFAIAFAVSGCWHIWQAIHYKSWRLTGLYVFCAVLFVGGFIVRAMGAYDYTNLVKFIISICLVYSAPPIFELANYNILGRALYYVPYHSPIHPGRVITTFAFISAVVEALNGNGAAISANQGSPLWYQKIGHSLLKAALTIQIVVILLFLWLAVAFHRRCLKAGLRSERLHNVLVTLYVSTALLMSRTIFRTVEYFSIADMHLGPGLDPKTLSPLIRYESFFYVFEALLMLCNQVMMNWRHPRRWLPKGTKTYLALDGVTEVEGPGYKDGRSFLVTLFDPFDLIGMARGIDRQNKYWLNDGVGRPAASDKAVQQPTGDTSDVV